MRANKLLKLKIHFGWSKYSETQSKGTGLKGGMHTAQGATAFYSFYSDAFMKAENKDT